jgi:hypothetical protein
MRRLRRFVVVVAVFGLSALATCDALATAPPLVLRVGGTVAPVGTPAAGVLSFGPCGTLQSSGALITNDRATDTAELPTVESEGGGGCGEGGPNASGRISRMRMSFTGHLTVIGAITYTTELPRKCIYRLTRLKGSFAIPGPTKTVVAGVGTREAGSDEGCAKTQRVEHAEATLDARATGEAFEAEP